MFPWLQLYEGENPQVSRKLIISNISIQSLGLFLDTFSSIHCVTIYGSIFFLPLKNLINLQGHCSYEWHCTCLCHVFRVFTHLSLQCTRHHSELHYSVRAYNKMSLIYFLVVTMYTHMFNIYVACPWPHSSAVKRLDFSTHWVTHSLIFSGFLMTVQCRGAWLKTNSPLSEAKKCA